MAEENVGDLGITIRVNKDTGNIEVAKAELKQFGDAAGNTTKSVQNTSAATQALTASMGRLVTVAAVIALFKDAVTEANQAAEAHRHLKTQMDAMGMSYDDNKARINSWAEAMQSAAHMADTTAVEALNKTITRTKDLETSLKLVQLSQDIFIATGKDQASTLDMLTRAQSGATRGLQQLKIAFGAQLGDTASATDAINKLAATYGGASTKAEEFSLSLIDFKNQLSSIKQSMGEQLITPLQDFKKEIDLNFLARFATSVTAVVSTMIAGLTTSAGIIKSIITGVAESVWYAVTGRISKATDAYDKAIAGIITATETGRATITKTWSDAIDRVNKKYDEHSTSVKSALVKVSNFHAESSAKDEQVLLESLERRLKAIQEVEKQTLQDATLVSAEKAAIIRESANEQISVVQQAAAQINEATIQSEARIVQIKAETQTKLNVLQQQGVTNWRQNMVSWVKYNTEMDARIAELGQQTFDNLASNFGSATAQMIMEGKDFTETFNALFTQLAEQVIAQITAMIAKWIVFTTLTGGTGTFLGLPMFAEGARVTSPTVAMVGEGGEGETVVPDSKAKGFALGVLAGNKSSGGGTVAAPSNTPGAGASGVIQLTIYQNLYVSDLNASERKRIMDALADDVYSQSASASKFAIALSDLASKNSGRAR